MKRPASRGDAERSGTPRRRGLGRGRKWVPRDQPASSEPPPSPRRSAPGARDHDTHRWDTHYGDTHYGDTHHWQPSDPPDPPTEPIRPEPRPEGPPPPRKITVTRVAAWRSRQLVGGGMRRFHQATTADGAGRSGLSSLTYASMMDYAASAAIAVALANTLFFAAASTTASRAHVALYLLITVAPFAVVAPVVGPLLDRLQHGRRFAMALSFIGRAFLLVVMARYVDSWPLYPAALGFLVLTKSYGVLQAAVIPRVLPHRTTLVKTNSRLTVFGLIAAGVSGALAAGVTALASSSGALLLTAVICLVGALLCWRIPSWVEVTEGEVPASLRTGAIEPPRSARPRQPTGPQVVLALWGNGTVRVLTGFLTLFVAFAVKAHTEHSPGWQLVLLGIVGAAAGAGGFLGNAVGARIHFGRPDQVILACAAAALTMAVLTALVGGIGAAAATALVASTGSAVAKVCLDAIIQRDVPEESRASAFGRSESILQIAWVLGGALGVLLPPTYWIGFAAVSVLLALGLAQTVRTLRTATPAPRSGDKLR